MSYADVNGVSMYYEEHGEGDPLVLLHGGLGSVEMFASLLPALGEGRRAILADFQCHGRTADIDRPLRPEHLADDVAALIEQRGAAPADVLGYSLGAEAALRLAIQHPAQVRRLVLVSTPCRRDGNFPDVLAAFDGMGPELAEPMRPSPPGALYARIAPNPDDWSTLIAKTAELLKVDFDWSEEVAALTMPVMLVFADTDSVQPAHVAEFYGLLGGGLRDAGWDMAYRPAARLAVIPGATHYDILESPVLAPAVLSFLG
jgi:pimeloyl-ACP methyl ester carboxylesterase